MLKYAYLQKIKSLNRAYHYGGKGDARYVSSYTEGII
jgi:hypothetical protein